MTKINIGTNKGNITNIEFDKPFTEISAKEILKIIQDKKDAGELDKQAVIIGWCEAPIKVSVEEKIDEAIQEEDVMQLRDVTTYLNFTDEESKILKLIEHAVDLRDEIGEVSDEELCKMIGTDIEIARKINYVLGWIEMSYQRRKTDAWRRLLLKFYYDK